jgi:hypothetical protein
MAEVTTTFGVRIPKKVLDRLRTEARRQNTSVNRLVTNLIVDHLPNELRDENPLDVLAPYIGALKGSPTDSTDIKSVFASGVRAKFEHQREEKP